MKAQKNKCISGLSLVEVMLAMVVIMFAVIGAIGFRSFCAMDAAKADEKISAARIASALIESWKGTGGDGDYDPFSQYGYELEISSSDDGLEVPEEFTEVGMYRIVSGGEDYFATLAYKDDATDVEPRILNVSVLCPHDREDNTQAGQSAKLSTYCGN